MKLSLLLAALLPAGATVVMFSGMFLCVDASRGDNGSRRGKGSRGGNGCNFDVDTPEIEASLVEFNDRFNEISTALDVQSLVALYDEDSLWIDSENPPIPGREGALTTFGFLAANNGSNFHTIDRLIISEDGSQAIMIGDADILVESQGLDFTGTYQFVLVRDGDDWKIMVDMFNMHVE
eukprot:TRINITY_DN8489_c0_g1_i1.p1 TRINITY_DN8489_c0_g1~~TRINITY_DN8489_c0_g1_i1.p1  ORF type:complete len:179 (+),score=26.29 TRINITY_DN8489_c0_g1_i1:55-591(+)